MSKPIEMDDPHVGRFEAPLPDHREEQFQSPADMEPEGGDEDAPVSADVKSILGFDPDEAEREEKQ